MQTSLMPDEPQIAKRAGPPRKKHKPFAVWHTGGLGGKTWRVWNRYVSLAVAKKALESFQRKYSFWEWKAGREKVEVNHDQVSEVDQTAGPTG